EGYLGYSLADDLLSGMGARDRQRRRALDPVRRRQPRLADLGRAVPGDTRLLRAHVHLPCLSDPAADRRAADGAPPAPRAQAPHPVPQRGAADRAQARRPAALPGVHTALARSLLRRLRRALPARRARADQPDLALGAVPHLLVDERRPARLVPRLADRGPAARAAVGLHGRP